MSSPPRRIAAFSKLSEVVGRGYASPAQAIDAILRLVRELFGASTAIVARLDDDRWRARFASDDPGNGWRIQAGLDLSVSDTFCQLIQRAGAPVAIDDALVDPRTRDMPAAHLHGVRSYIGVPLVFRDGSLFGTLCAQDRDVASLDDEDVALLEVLARLVAHELEHEREVASIREEHQQHLNAIVETAADAIVTMDDQGTIIDWNAAAEEMFGWSRIEVIGRSARMLLPESAISAHEAELASLRTNGRVPLAGAAMELDASHRLGHTIPVEVTLGHRDLDSARRYTAVVRDISARKQVELELAQSEARFRSLFQHASELVTIVDKTGVITYKSPALTELLGLSSEELVGKLALDFVHPDDVAEVATAIADLAQAPLGTQGPLTQFRFRYRDGSWRWLEALGTNLLGDEAVSGIVVNSRDVTERRALENRLKRQANRDSLTGLPNRRYFLEQIRDAVMNDTPAPVAVVFLDLDDFKVVNDSLGHSAGDLLLIAVAQRLKRFLQSGDMLARLGGDEFTFLMNGVATPEDVMETAARILASFREPFAVAGRELSLTPSIGIAVGVPTEDRPDELLRQADLAMYSAKWQGKSGAVVFDQEMDVQARDRLELGEGLRRAVPQDELRIHYQPIIDLRSGQIAAFEALVRWNNPRYGLLRPDALIPVAEETGMVVPIGRWVLGEACKIARSWQTSLPGSSSVGVAVNFAALHFRDPKLLVDIQRVLGQTGLAPEALTVELSEHVALDDTPGTAATLKAVSDLGVHLAIDDFGTGFSGLGALKAAPVHTIKIDQSFVAGLGVDEADLAIVRAIITLARAMGLGVVAEGVETQEQLGVLRALGCEQAQGFLFSPPVLADEAVTLLEHGWRRPLVE